MHCVLYLAQGEAATKELNDKLQNFTNDAMRFTMDGGMNGEGGGGPCRQAQHAHAEHGQQQAELQD